MKWFAGSSILLNFALLVAWWLPGRGEVNDADTRRASQSTFPRTLIVTNVVDVVTTNMIAVPVFQWAMIESERYEEYMANLRRLDCPEWLVKEIVLADLTRFYEARKTALEHDRPSSYWMTSREQRQVQLKYDQAAGDLEQEEHDVMLQLTGSYRNGDGDEVHSDPSILALAFAGLDYDQGRSVLSETMFRHKQSETFTDLRNNLLTPADLAELGARYQEMKNACAVLASPASFDEFWLRLQLVVGSLRDGFDLRGMRLSGFQLRNLVRIRSEIIDPFRAEFVDREQRHNDEPDRLNRMVEEQLGLDLGADVAADYARARTPAFREIYDFATDQQLPRQTAVDVFDVRQTAINEVDNLTSNPDLDDTRKIELRQLIRLETEKALRSKLGPTVFETYRQQHGQWLDQFDGRDPFAGLNLPSMEAPQ